MKNIYTRLFFIALIFSSSQALFAQVSAYTFTPLSGAFVPVGSNHILLVDTLQEAELCADTGIGFSFVFGGIAYTRYQASSAGYISFQGNIAPSHFNNYHSLSNSADRPIIAPFYDDEKTGVNGSGVFSELTGSAPDRVLTIEWRRIRWWWSNTADSVISYEVKLHETSNRIEFVYSLGVNYSPIIHTDLQNNGATIGLADSVSFISVITTNINPQVSTVSENDTIGYAPGTGVIYRFDPPAATAIADVEVAQEMKIARLDAQGLFRISNLPVSGTVNIYDISGRLIKVTAVNYGVADINLYIAPAGVYLFTINSPGQRMQAGKLIKY